MATKKIVQKGLASLGKDPMASKIGKVGTKVGSMMSGKAGPMTPRTAAKAGAAGVKAGTKYSMAPKTPKAAASIKAKQADPRYK